MLLDFNKLIKKYSLKINGVIHIGAHCGEEHKFYLKNNIKHIVYFEPDPNTFIKLEKNVSNSAILYNLALGNKTGVFEFNVSSNGGASSSILKPKKHLIRHPKVQFNEKININMVKLDDIQFDRSSYNFINIDVQGYELEVFKGGCETLKNIDYVMTEVNRDEVYEDCAQIGEIDKYLNNLGFERVETTWDGGIWGDAFYIKNK
jgi:FkbM family methyltransferase